MIHVKPGNLVAVFADGRYYYAAVLKNLMPRARGHWCFVFHKTSEQILSAGEVLNGAEIGFYDLVDFIWAKRQNRLIRIAERVAVESFNYPGLPISRRYRCVSDAVLIQRINQSRPQNK
jgi:hypothetical protein